jgi:hypothetical protein
VNRLIVGIGIAQASSACTFVGAPGTDTTRRSAGGRSTCRRSRSARTTSAGRVIAVRVVWMLPPESPVSAST